MSKPGCCPICDVALKPYACIPGEELGEVFYTPELRALVPELRYGQCPECRSIFATDGRSNPELLAETYAALPASYWQPLENDHRLQSRTERQLQRWAPGKRLCDVGCGDGAWLASFGEQWKRFGIEPGASAAERCQQRGLEVHVGTAGDVHQEEPFDALTCIDVTEHLPNPIQDLREITRLVRQDGILVIFTGDPATWSARMAGAAWQYLHCVGHISILSRHALRRILEDLGFELLTQATLSHASSVGFWDWLRRWRHQRRRQRQGKRLQVMPYFHDHQFIVARRVRLANIHVSSDRPVAKQRASLAALHS